MDDLAIQPVTDVVEAQPQISAVQAEVVAEPTVVHNDTPELAVTENSVVAPAVEESPVAAEAPTTKLPGANTTEPTIEAPVMASEVVTSISTSPSEVETKPQPVVTADATPAETKTAEVIPQSVEATVTHKMPEGLEAPDQTDLLAQGRSKLVVHTFEREIGNNDLTTAMAVDQDMIKARGGEELQAA